MKRNIFISIFIVAFANNLLAQNPLVKQWDKRFGGTDDDHFYSFQQTNDGGYILGGISISGISGDKTQPSWGGFDYWIVKIDWLGIKQWDKRFGGTSNDDVLNSLHQTTDGGYILGGYSGSGVGGDKTQPSWGSYDYWILKIDSLGIKQWDNRFGGTSTDYLYSIQQTTDGGYILGGFSNSGIGGDKTQPSWGDFDYWIVKVDSVGIKQWDKRFGGTSTDYLYSLQQTADGGYILGGYSESGISGDKTQPSWGNGDYWIIKVDSLGIKQWDKRYGGIDYDMLYSLQQITDGGYILEGFSASGISGDKTQPSWGGWDWWILKIDSLGNKQWDKRFGGTDYEEAIGNISQTSDGGYLIAGTSYSNISGDKSESNLGPEQTWVLKTDSLGNKQWDKTLHTNNANDDEVGFAIQTKDGCYAMANFTAGGVGGDKTQVSQGSYDYWIIKFCDSNFVVIPSINLSSSDTTFCEKQCINFTDLSTNNPTSWQWFFPGADSTISTLQNPTNICYSNYGIYDVTLIACNAAGCDTLVLYNFIHEFQNPTATITQSNDTLYASVGVSYQWFSVDSGLIAGATTNYFVTNIVGHYFVVVTDSNGCEGASNVIAITTGIETIDGNAGMDITPNPATNSIEITFAKSFNHNTPLQVFDLTGRMVYSKEINCNEKRVMVDVSMLGQGTYFIKVNASVRKIVKM